MVISWAGAWSRPVSPPRPVRTHLPRHAAGARVGRWRARRNRGGPGFARGQVSARAKLAPWWGPSGSTVPLGSGPSWRLASPSSRLPRPLLQSRSCCYPSLPLTPWRLPRPSCCAGSFSVSGRGGLVLAFPRFFVALVNRIMELTGRSPLELPMHYRAYLRGVAWTAGQCLLMGSAFWLVARSVAPVAGGDWYLFTVSLLVAGIVGFFAFFAPAGIGVREGLLLALLHGSDR